MRLIILIFIILLTLNSVSSSNLGISPSNLNFNLTENQQICKKFFIQGEGIVIGSDRWMKDSDSRNLPEHKLNSDELKLKVDYPEQIYVEGEKREEICISGKNAGYYHGVLLYRTEEGYAGVGSWISLNITKDEATSSVFHLTGKTIADISEKTSGAFFVFLFTALVFVFALVILLKKV